MHSDNKPDYFWMRFICGFLAGSVFTMIKIATLFPSTWVWPTGISGMVGCVTGLLAARYGDRIWSELARAFTNL